MLKNVSFSLLGIIKREEDADLEKTNVGKNTPSKSPELADTTLVRVPKHRFGSKYAGVLRSPQKLKMFWGPHSRAS